MSERRPASGWMAVGLSAALMLGAAACEESDGRGPVDAGAADAGPNQPVMDKNIAEAVASAAARPGGSTAAQGPPPTGVFAPGQADQAHALGKPVDVQVVEAGAEPRVRLAGGWDLSKPSKLRLTIARALPGGQMPNVDYTLRVQGAKGAAKAPEANPDSDAGAPAAPAKPQPIVVTVLGAAPSKDQPGQVPADLGKVLETLVGTRIHGVLAADGSLSEERIELGAEVQSPLDDFARGLEDVIGMFMSPMPTEPVGVGAYWIASDRTDVAGMKVVRYRVTKVDKLVGDEAALSLDVRLYLVDDQQKPAIAQGEAVAVGFVGQGAAAWTVRRGALMPTSGQLKLPFIVQLAAPQQPDRVIPLQFEVQALVQPGAVAPPPAAPAPAAPPPAAP